MMGKKFSEVIQDALEKIARRKEAERMERQTKAMERLADAIESDKRKPFVLSGILKKEDYRILLDVGKSIGFLGDDYSLNDGISKAKFLTYAKFIGDKAGIPNYRQICGQLWFDDGDALKMTRSHDDEVYQECKEAYKRLIK